MNFLKKIHGWVIAALIAVNCFLQGANASLNEAGNFNAAVPTTVSYETVQNLNDPAVVDAYTYIFADNVYHLSQQRDAQLLPYAEMLGLVRDSRSINRIGVLDDPRPYEARMAQVKGTNPENDVRWVEAKRFYHACFVDDYDQIRTLFSLQNAYTVAIARSFGRFYDRIFISAAIGTACTRPDRSGRVPLPTSQQMCAFDGSTTTGVGLNVTTLNRMRMLQKSRFAVARGDMMVYVISSGETYSLLEQERATSRDYTNVLGLVNGELSSFMGMLFVESELLHKNATDLKYDVMTGAISASGTGNLAAGAAVATFCFVANQSVCFGINNSLQGMVTQLPERHNNWLIYYRAEFGAVRKEEVQVRVVYTLDQRGLAA